MSRHPASTATLTGENFRVNSPAHPPRQRRRPIGADLRVHPCWTDVRGRPGVTWPNQDAHTVSVPVRR